MVLFKSYYHFRSYETGFEIQKRVSWTTDISNTQLERKY